MSAAGLGRLSRSASKIVAKAANGFHLLRVDGYSQTKRILPGQMLSSQEFTIGGHSWRIDYYPNGRDAACAKSDTISVYLQLTDRNQLPQQARYKFSLLDHAGNAAYELPAETGSFTSVHKADVYPHLNAYSPSQLAGIGQLGSPVAGEEPGPGCGHEDFIRREELERRREHLIRDDRMVVRCDVAVTEIQSSYLAQDELSLSDEEEDQEYEGPGYSVFSHPRRRRRRSRTDDDEYVKWCLTHEPGGGSRGRRQGRR